MEATDGLLEAHAAAKPVSHGGTNFLVASAEEGGVPSDQSLLSDPELQVTSTTHHSASQEDVRLMARCCRNQQFTVYLGSAMLT